MADGYVHVYNLKLYNTDGFTTSKINDKNAFSTR
jgi:hypothetical protein